MLICQMTRLVGLHPGAAALSSMFFLFGACTGVQPCIGCQHDTGS